MDEARRAALVAADASLMEAVLAGDEERFYREIAAVEDANKVCGFGHLYLMLRYLGEPWGRGDTRPSNRLPTLPRRRTRPVVGFDLWVVVGLGVGHLSLVICPWSFVLRPPLSSGQV